MDLRQPKNIPTDMNTKPWKYATHCLKANEASIFTYIDGQQYLYIDNSWQPSDVYHGILKEIEFEYHTLIDNSIMKVNRTLIKSYQAILDEKGHLELDTIQLKLSSMNSDVSLENLNAIFVVLSNNNLVNN